VAAWGKLQGGRSVAKEFEDSAPSGSAGIATVPTPSGADDEQVLDDAEDSVLSLAVGRLAV